MIFYPHEMTIERLKDTIRSLPDEEIGPLLEWLGHYYDDEVWDRQIARDIERVGPEQFAATLRKGMEEASPQRQAALRLLNSARFCSDLNRKSFLRDLEIVIGGSLESE